MAKSSAAENIARQVSGNSTSSLPPDTNGVGEELGAKGLVNLLPAGTRIGAPELERLWMAERACSKRRALRSFIAVARFLC